jgi:hypothetical protein
MEIVDVPEPEAGTDQKVCPADQGLLPLARWTSWGFWSAAVGRVRRGQSAAVPLATQRSNPETRLG